MALNVFGKLSAVVKQQLTQGADPRGLAISCALACTFGTFPILGTTTFLCFVFGLWLRANQPIVQALNYLLYPVQLILIPVFLKAGQVLFHSPVLAIMPLELMAKFRADWRAFLGEYGWAAAHAVVVWLLVAPFFAAAVFILARRTFEKVARKVKSR